MAINVNAAGNVSPSVMEGGTAGDNKATNISFVLDPSLVSEEKFYQIQALTAQGVFDVTEYLTPEENTLSYDIPFGWSVGGGVSAVRILITTPDGDNPILWYSDPVSVTFKPNPQGKFCLKNPFALAQLVSQTKENANNAQENAKLAEEMAYSASQYEENAKQHALQAEQSANDAANQATEAANEAVNEAFPLVSNALKRSVSGVEVTVNDASPLNRKAKVKVEGATAITVSGRNLYTLEGRTQVDLGEQANTTPRTFTGNGYFYPYNAANYFKSSRDVVYSFDAENGEIAYTPEYANYGIGVDIAVEPNAKYLIKADYYSANSKIAYAFYDSDGVWLSLAQVTSFAIVTAPASAKWMTVVVISPTDNTAITVGGIQVIKSSINVTDFEQATPKVEYPVSADGTVEVDLLPNTTVLSTDTAGAVLTVDYSRDINVAFEELKQAIINLGGNV